MYVYACVRACTQAPMCTCMYVYVSDEQILSNPKPKVVKGWKRTRQKQLHKTAAVARRGGLPRFAAHHKVLLCSICTATHTYVYIFFYTRYWRVQQCRTCVRSTAKGSSRREENVSSTIKPNAVPSTSRPDGKRELGACHAIRFEGRDNVEVQRSMGNIPLDRLPS